MLLHTAELAANPARCISEGDLVVVYEGFDHMKAVRVAVGAQFQNKFGGFSHSDWLGKPFGTRVTCKRGSAWVVLLAPTPELWTSVLRHRTQILYAADIAMVCALLELRPGSVVLESGTGSGSLTHSLARAVAPAGHVWTYEFHEQRAALAGEEFKANGLSGLVTVTQRDIEEGGFPQEMHGRADALFLDLPKPHKVVPSAARCVRPDGVFCSFSPCIEQVQGTCEALNACGFRDIRTMEVLVRQLEVSRQALLTDMEAPPPQGRKQPRQGQAPGQGGKRQKGADGGAAAAGEGAGEAAGAADGAADTPADNGQQAALEEQPQQAAAAAPPPERRPVSRPVPFGRGHTGYLTFARRVVDLP